MTGPQPPQPPGPVPGTTQPGLVPPGSALPGVTLPRAGRAPRGGRVLLAGIIGLVVGALLVGAAWLGTSLVGGSKDGAAGDVATACEILDRLPAAKDLSLAYADRLEAAGSLADAAARDDARYRHLAEDAKQALQAAQFNDGAKVDERIGAAREDCRGF